MIIHTYEARRHFKPVSLMPYQSTEGPDLEKLRAAVHKAAGLSGMGVYRIFMGGRELSGPETFNTKWVRELIAEGASIHILPVKDAYKPDGLEGF